MSHDLTHQLNLDREQLATYHRHVRAHVRARHAYARVHAVVVAPEYRPPMLKRNWRTDVPLTSVHDLLEDSLPSPPAPDRAELARLRRATRAAARVVALSRGGIYGQEQSGWDEGTRAIIAAYLDEAEAITALGWLILPVFQHATGRGWFLEHGLERAARSIASARKLLAKRWAWAERRPLLKAA